MSEQLTLASLFDGSGGFPLAGILSNINPIWASEVALFPIRVTTKRLPNMKHYGNVSKINGAEVEPVDIITFGSPCQDLSLAGKRSGLEGERSGLFFEAVRIIKEMRDATNGRKPRYIVWENVYGAFSSNNGKDFQQVITEIAQIKHPDFITPGCEEWESSGEILADDFSIAWRGLDAKFWGVPQRRKRIFLVADFNGQGASKILFESEGLSRYSPESFRAWQRFTQNFEERTNKASCGVDGYNGSIDDVSPTLGVNCGMSTGRNGVMALNDQGGSFMSVSHDVTATLRSQTNDHPPLVMDAFGVDHVAITGGTTYQGHGWYENVSGCLKTQNHGVCAIENHPNDSRLTISEDGKVQALTSRMGTGGGNVPLIGIPYTLKIRCGKEGGGKGALIQENQSATLSCGNDQTLFVMATSQPNAEITENQSLTITATAGMSGNNIPILIADARNGTLDDTAPSMQAAYDHTNNAGGLVMQAYGILRQVEGVQIDENKSPTIMAASGTSGNNKPSVAYNISSKDSNEFKSDNPKVGIYETEIAKTLDAIGGNPNCNQGGTMIVSVDMGAGKSSCSIGENISPTLATTHGGEPVVALEGNGSRPSHQGCDYNEDNVSFILNATEHHAVAFGGGDFISVGQEVAGTLLSRDWKEPQTVGFYPYRQGGKLASIEEKTPTLINGTCPGYQNGVSDSQYIVRRLTPTECARLQGFPDWWCADLDNDEMGLDFWRNAFDEWSEISGSKKKSDKEILKWLKKPYSEAEEYKMWGNGVALPCVFFVLAGIDAWNDGKLKEEDDDLPLLQFFKELEL